MTRGSKNRTAPGDRETLSIGALSRATRIPVETIRTWEQRYGAPVATRKPSGHRLYPASAVEQLRRVGRLLAQGHRPGEVLRLSLNELNHLLSLAEPAAVPGLPGAKRSPLAATHERLLGAAMALDRAAMMRELQSGWARLGPLRFLEQVAGEFMVAVGRAWSEDRIEVRHEHFAYACLSDFLRGVREPFDQQARGPRVVAAMLRGERHEGGLLMSSVLLAVRGYRVLYLGLDTPIEQIAAAAESANAEAVAISASAAVPRARAARDVAALRKALPRRVRLWVGGAGAPPAARGVERFASLSELDERLREVP